MKLSWQTIAVTIFVALFLAHSCWRDHRRAEMQKDLIRKLECVSRQLDELLPCKL